MNSVRKNIYEKTPTERRKSRMNYDPIYDKQDELLKEANAEEASIAAPEAKKQCLSCGKDKKASNFYVNKGNAIGEGRDFWCRDCVKKYITGKTTLESYCQKNNRAFNEVLWEESFDKAVTTANSDPVLSKNKKSKDMFVGEATVKRYLSQMNQAKYYESVDETYTPQEPDHDVEIEVESHEPEGLTYSEHWGGFYSQKHLSFLDKLYRGLEDQFDLSDIHLQDNAKKVAQASLDVEIARNRYRSMSSKENSDLLSQAIKIYRDLSDQAKFSANKRTAGDRVGYSDLGTLIARVEQTGRLDVEIEFPKDEVDYIRENYIAGLMQSLHDENTRLEEDYE